jgi:predicted nucleic acid-binding protein
MIVDTDIFIDVLRGRKPAKEFFKDHLNRIKFSAVTEADLLAGKECGDFRRKELITRFLSQFEKISVDNPMIQIAGRIRRETSLALPDSIIAASALENKMYLVSRNLKDFSKVKGLNLKIPY